MPETPVPVATLTVLGGAAAGNAFVIEDAVDEILIGSDPGCGFCLELPSVSPIHARFWLDLAGATIYDTHSPHGVYVNDDRVESQATVRDGDIIWLGAPGDPESVMIQFRMGPAATSSASSQPEAVPEVAPEPPPLPAEFLLEDLIAPAPAPAEGGFATDEFLFEDTAQSTEEPLSDEAVIVQMEESTGEAAAAPPKPEAPAQPAKAASPPPPAPVVAHAKPTPVALPKPPAVAAPPPEARVETTPAVASAPARRPESSKPADAPTRSRRTLGIGIGIGAAAIVLAGMAFLAIRFWPASPPRLDAVSPMRTSVGQKITLRGERFAPRASDDVVRFGDTVGRVVQASAKELQVEVPEIPITSGQQDLVPVKVVVDGRESASQSITLYQPLRIHGLSPSVAMPGEEIVLVGAGWGGNAKVRFGAVEATIAETTPNSIRLRVPDLAASVGAAVPVVVTDGDQASNVAPFMVGRLPLVLPTDQVVAMGDLLSLAGRGFSPTPSENIVTIAGNRALVVAASEGELKLLVPRVTGNTADLELKVAGLDNVGRASLAVTPPPLLVPFRFTAEPFADAAGHDHAVIHSALGPVLVLSASAGRSAAERAAEAVKRLNDAGNVLRASLEADFELRNAESDPSIGLSGRPDIVLTPTNEDVTAYEEDWTRSGSKGGPVTRARLGQWWTAVLRDLALLLVRREAPRYAASLAAEGRVLVDLSRIGQKAGVAGVPYRVVTEGKPDLRGALRNMAFRVPVLSSSPAEATARSPQALRLEGTWIGSEQDGDGQKWVTITFNGSRGTLTYERALTLSVPLHDVTQPQRGSVRFSLAAGGRMRYYTGKWDGQKISGTLSNDPAGANPIGTFELAPR